MHPSNRKMERTSQRQTVSCICMSCTVHEALPADRWFSYSWHLLLIHLMGVWLRAKGDVGRSAPWQEPGPHPPLLPLAQLNPTSAARPVLTDLKAVSAETEGAVSRHDAAVAAPELVAG